MKPITLHGLLFAGVVASTCAACTKLDDPYAGVAAEEVFELQVNPGGADQVLLANGRAAMVCKVLVKDRAALYSQNPITVNSDALTFSSTGLAAGSTSTLTVPLIGRTGTFYVIAPRNFGDRAQFVVSFGTAQITGGVPLKASVPNRLDIAPLRLNAKVGTPVSFTTTLTDTAFVPQPISGKLQVQFDPVAPTPGTARPLVGSSVAQSDGSATVLTSFVATDTGTYRFRARVLGVRSPELVIRCR